MQLERDESRVLIDRMLYNAGWEKDDIFEEENISTGRMDYRLSNLCILEAKKPTTPNKEYELKLHLQQSQRYHRHYKEIPFLMVSDGMLHFIQDTRNGQIERIYTLPSKEELEAVINEEATLRNGYIYQPSNLFDFQGKAIRNVIDRIVDGDNDERMLLEMATGTGKTVVATGIINEVNKIIQEREGRPASILFLVDRDALEDQSAEKLNSFVKSIKINTIDSLGEARIDVLVAQVATMQHRYNKHPFNPNYFDLIIIDEAHRSVHGGVWRNVIEIFKCPQVGLTATPPRFGDDETINYFGEPIFIFSYDDGVSQGMLAPCVIHRVRTNIDLEGIVIGDKHYKSEDFEVQLHIDNRDKEIVKYYKDNFYGKKCLVFATGAKHLASLWEKFNEMFNAQPDGYAVKFVMSSHESAKARREIIEDFQDNDSDTKVLINLNILTAGFDYPELDLLFMCRYTRHKSLYLQMKGRGSRLPFDKNGRILTNESGLPLKDRFTMVDFVGVTMWEDKDFEPYVKNSDMEEEYERVVNNDPNNDKRDKEKIVDIDVEVKIAEVEIIDPFNNDERKNESLNQELTLTKNMLSEERDKVQEFEYRVSALQTQLKEERRKYLTLQKDSFKNQIITLKRIAPFVPITEELMRQVNPSITNLNILNESFEVYYNSIQEHIDSIIREEINNDNES